MQEYMAYALVFFAVVLPIALWRREGGDDRQREPGWGNLPSAYKIFWRPAYLLESSIGALISGIMPVKARLYGELISAAALPLTPGRVFVCQLFIAIVVGLLGSISFIWLPTGPSVAITLFAALVGWTLPFTALRGYAERRQEEISKALPFAIDLIGSAMRAGLDFGAALRYYTGLGCGGALKDEFSHVLQDVTLGKPFTEGLVDMAARLHIKAFTAFAGVVSYGAEIGASIAATLKLHGAELRRERFAIAERKAARAPSLMIFPLAVFIMPAVFIVIFVPVFMQFKAAQG